MNWLNIWGFKMTQATLFQNPTALPSLPVAFARGSQTSYEAAQSVMPRVEKLYAAIVTALESGNLTPDEIAARIGVEKHNVRSRCTELTIIGGICTTNEKRANASGRQATVLRLATDDELRHAIATHRLNQAKYSDARQAWCESELARREAA